MMIGLNMSRHAPMALLIALMGMTLLSAPGAQAGPQPGLTYNAGQMSATMSKVLFDQAYLVVQGWEETSPTEIDVPALTDGNVASDATALIIAVRLHTRQMGLSVSVGPDASAMREVHRVTAYGNSDNFTQITEVLVPYNGADGSLTYMLDWIDEYNPFVHGSNSDMARHTHFDLYVKGYMSPKQDVYHLRDVSTASGGYRPAPECHRATPGPDDGSSQGFSCN